MASNNPLEQGLTRYLKPQQLEKIRAAKIGIAGAGGLGSNIAVALARTGFRQLTILDQDVVEASNLNRQDYLPADIGKPKVKVLKQRLITINPDMEIMAHQSTWTMDNAQNFFSSCDILVEAFDQALLKRDFTEWALSQQKPVISGNGMAGFTGGDPTVIRQINNLYIVGDGISSIHDGHPPLAPRVIQCAAKMAEIVLNLTLGTPL